MAELATLARPYANAAFDLAKANGTLVRWSRMLTVIADIVRTPEVRALIGSPSLPDEAKAYRLADVAREEIDDHGRRFLLVLAANKRLALLPEIAEQFEALKARSEQVLDVEIATAVALSDEQLGAYTDALERRFEQEVHVTAQVDAQLIGGAVIRAADTVIDGSVRGRLIRLVDTLQRA